jgi:D-sedoheptulose 7-phosphate isomerase
MAFPEKPYADCGRYMADYRDALIDAWNSVSETAIDRAAGLIDAAVRADHSLFACGNGGSASISNHLLCDYLKGMQTDTDLRPRVISLSSHVELITAIANDITYDDVFAYQLRTMARPGDVLMTISSSGNSENIVRAVEWARDNDVKSIALTGFGGGRSATLADVNIHVRADNYGIIEDIHQSLMHIMAQYLRLRAMPQALIAERRF